GCIGVDCAITVMSFDLQRFIINITRSPAAQFLTWRDTCQAYETQIVSLHEPHTGIAHGMKGAIICRWSLENWQNWLSSLRTRLKGLRGHWPQYRLMPPRVL